MTCGGKETLGEAEGNVGEVGKEGTMPLVPVVALPSFRAVWLACSTGAACCLDLLEL